MTDFEKATKEGYEIKKAGKSTFLIVDIHGSCFSYYDTERKAVNGMNKIGKFLQKRKSV